MRGSTHRGRNQFTKAALSRAVDVARQKGIDHVEVEIPGGSRIIFKGIVNKQACQEGEKPEDITDLLK
jgi:hypothetical protein